MGRRTIHNLLQLASSQSMAQRMSDTEKPCVRRWTPEATVAVVAHKTVSFGQSQLSNAPFFTDDTARCFCHRFDTCVQEDAGACGAVAGVSAAGDSGAAVASLQFRPEAGGLADCVDSRRVGWVARFPVRDRQGAIQLACQCTLHLNGNAAPWHPWHARKC